MKSGVRGARESKTGLGPKVRASKPVKGLKTGRTQVKPPSDLESLVESITPLVQKLVAIQNRMRSLGMFPNDRELLQCHRCGLMEDVTSTGLLLTYRESDPPRDSGLRFEPLNKDGFRCPACGETVSEPLET